MGVCEGSSSCNGCNCPQTIRLNPAKASNTTVITSPSFPNKYTKNQNCKWIINATKGKLKLTFDKFKTEWSQNCKKDYLFVGNVSNTTSSTCADRIFLQTSLSNPKPGQ